MQPDTRIPLAFQTPDFVGSMARGAQAGQFVNEARHQNALRSAFQEHGPGLVQGDQNALAAISRLDPAMALGVQDTRSQMQHRDRAADRDDQRLQLAYQQAGMKAQQFAMEASAQERQALRDEFEQGAQMIAAAQTPEQFAAVLRLPGVAEAVEAFVGPGMGSFENRQIIAAAAMGAKDAMEATGGPQEPANMQTLRLRAQEAGLQPGTPQYQEFMLQGSAPQTNVTVNTGSEVGSIPQGWELLTDPETGARRLQPIAEGPVAQDMSRAEDQEVARQAQRARAGSTVIQDLQRGLDLLPDLGAIARGEGVAGGITRTGQASIPGTVANRITNFTESALSNVGLDTLQQMRENSPTGGALGQVPIQQQQRLEQVLGSLNISQPPSVLEANIKRVMNIYTDIIYGSAEERARAVEQGRMTPGQSAEIDGFYYDLPFDERGRPVQGGGGDNFGAMSLDSLLSVDIDRLSDSQIRAYNRRMEELLNAQ